MGLVGPQLATLDSRSLKVREKPKSLICSACGGGHSSLRACVGRNLHNVGVRRSRRSRAGGWAFYGKDYGTV